MSWTHNLFWGPWAPLTCLSGSLGPRHSQAKRGHGGKAKKEETQGPAGPEHHRDTLQAGTLQAHSLPDAAV